MAAQPGAADEVADVLLPRFLLPVVKGLGVAHGVGVADGQLRAHVVAVVVEVVNGVFGLRLVQPEHIDAAFKIIFAALIPQIPAGAGVGGVVDVRIAQKVEALRAALGADEQVFFAHLFKVFALFIHRRPDRDHAADAVFFELAHHGGGVGPVDGVELPLALARPMEKVDDDHVQRDAAAVVFARHFQHLFLRAVAQLALPQPRGVFGEGGRAADEGGVVGEDVFGRFVGGHPVIALPRGRRVPLGEVGSEVHPAHGGAVPQKAVPQRREGEGHRTLRIALGKL